METPDNFLPTLELVEEVTKPVYVNNASVTLSSFEVRIVFSEILEREGSVFRAGLRANLVMSHIHVRALSAALQTVVAQLDEIAKSSAME